MANMFDVYNDGLLIDHTEGEKLETGETPITVTGLKSNTTYDKVQVAYSGSYNKTDVPTFKTLVRNLIVRTGELVGKMIGVEGTIIPYNESSVTPAIITVTPGEQLTMFGTTGGDNNFRYAFYDESGNTIVRSYTQVTPATTVTTPINAVTFRISYPTSSKVMLERGNTASEWIPAPEDNVT